MKSITFNELRRIKDSLPDGSMQKLADELGLTVVDVRNYFGGMNQSAGERTGIHVEPGPDGGIVILDDSTILEKALIMLGENQHKISSVTKNV